MTDSTEVYNFTVATGHDAKLKPQEENGLTHDWSIYVKGAQGTRLFRYYNFSIFSAGPEPIGFGPWIPDSKLKFNLDSIWLSMKSNSNFTNLFPTQSGQFGRQILLERIVLVNQDMLDSLFISKLDL